MITEMAEASAELIHLIDDLLHQTQTRRLDAATTQASDDVQHFKDELLARDLDALNLQLSGLQHGSWSVSPTPRVSSFGPHAPASTASPSSGFTPEPAQPTLPPSAVKSFATPPGRKKHPYVS